jgi:hypothetical protein
VKVRDYVDYFAYPMYGSWRASAYTPNTPYGQYSPMAVDMGHGGSAVRPNFATSETQATNHLNGDYGVMFFYGLYSRNRYGATGTYTDTGGNSYDTKPTYFGAAGRTPEEYMSQISNAVYGQNVTYVGDDYPQDWTRR